MIRTFGKVASNVVDRDIRSTTLQRKDIFAFPRQQWPHESATYLAYTIKHLTPNDL
jgi:hypothetical protein